MNKIYAILDRFHPHINGETTPEVRSDNPAFDNLDDFFVWCAQHGANDSEVYEIK